MGKNRGYRFPHTVAHFSHLGRDGRSYTISLKYYSAVLRTPQNVFFEMLIEGPDGYRKELHGDTRIRPVMERIWADKHSHHTVDYTSDLSQKMCDLCRQEIRRAHAEHQSLQPETCSICRAHAGNVRLDDLRVERAARGLEP